MTLAEPQTAAADQVGVPIQPLPEQWQVGQTVGPDGHVWTQIQICGPWGVMIHQLPAKVARQVGVLMQRAGSTGEELLVPGGLIVPGGG